jgi:hypothetical protein
MTRTPTTTDRSLARKVLQTEAAAITALVERLVGDHLPEDCRDAREHRDVGVLPPSRRSDAR